MNLDKLDDKVKEKLAMALTSTEVDIIDFLPYLLQDYYEIGTPAEDTAQLFREYIWKADKDLTVLDLACGKGAASIRLAKEFGVKAKGIDLMEAFIDEANAHAKEYEVEDLCEFETGDINEAVKREKNYDVVIFGAVGDVLGTPEETIKLLKSTIKEDGYIIINDAYYREGKTKKDLRHKYDYITKSEWMDIFKRNSLEILKELEDADDVGEEIEGVDEIEKRAEELILKYPGKEKMFRDYIKSQNAECYDLEHNIYGVIWLLRSE